MPVYSDNVDGTDALTVTLHPAGLKPSHRFEIGSVLVRYTVTDTAGLSAECYFKVVVLGTFGKQKLQMIHRVTHTFSFV